MSKSMAIVGQCCIWLCQNQCQWWVNVASA